MLPVQQTEANRSRNSLTASLAKSVNCRFSWRPCLKTKVEGLRIEFRVIVFASKCKALSLVFSSRRGKRKDKTKHTKGQTKQLAPPPQKRVGSNRGTHQMLTSDLHPHVHNTQANTTYRYKHNRDIKVTRHSDAQLSSWYLETRDRKIKASLVYMVNSMQARAIQ